MDFRAAARALFAAIFFITAAAFAQEAPYFVTIDHHMPDDGDLEITAESTIGRPHAPIPGYFAPALELEYGITDRWTAELYLEGQSTRRDSTIFTGWRLEQRIRPMKREHWINPVLYFEYENINEASRIQKEIVGHAERDWERNAELRQDHAHEIEGKLILSSNTHGWNISENFIAEKNVTRGEEFEFGYALGVNRRLAEFKPEKALCRICRQNFVGGLELYGGLGDLGHFGLPQTAHYLAPVVAWGLSPRSSFKVSPAFGLTPNSDRLLLRFAYSYELEDFGKKVAGLFGKR